MLWDEPSLSAFRGFQIPRPVNRSSIPFHHRQTRRPKRGVDSRLESCQAVAMSHQAARAGNGAHTSEVHPSLRTAVLSCGNLSKPASRLRVWRLGGLCVVERGADEFRRQLGGTFSALSVDLLRWTPRNDGTGSLGRCCGSLQASEEKEAPPHSPAPSSDPSDFLLCASVHPPNRANLCARFSLSSMLGINSDEANRESSRTCLGINAQVPSVA